MTSTESTRLNLVEEILQSLGMAAAALQTYASDHPRVKTSLEATADLLNKLFEQGPDERHLVFLLHGTSVEFRGIPLSNTGPHAERIIRALKARDLGGLQLDRGISPAELEVALRSIGFKPSAGDAPEKASSSPAASGQDGSNARFHVASQSEVDELRKGGDVRASLSGKTDRLPHFAVFEGTARSLLKTYRAILSKPEEVLRTNQSLLHSTIQRVVNVMGPNREKLVPTVTRSYFDDFTYHHSVNVCLITGLVASTIIKTQEILSQISLAALLHDVGKSRVPEEILHKPGPLTPAEEQVLQRHPVEGAEILLGVAGLDPLCVAVAFGHHRAYGRKSYPKTLLSYKCDWITRLISIVDIYEALTAARPYKKGMSAESAFSIMLSLQGIENDLSLLRLLYSVVGPFPVGTTVELSTGERATVLSWNLSHPRLPRVQVLTDPSLGRLEKPVTLDLSDAGSSSFNGTPRTIRRAIVPQSASQSLISDEVEPEPTEILGAPVLGNEVFTAREG